MALIKSLVNLIKGPAAATIGNSKPPVAKVPMVRTPERLASNGMVVTQSPMRQHGLPKPKGLFKPPKPGFKKNPL